MAEIRIRRSIIIEATTVGDVAKWIRHIEGIGEARMSTELTDPVTLEIDVNDTITTPD